MVFVVTSVFAQPWVLVPWAPPCSQKTVLSEGPREATSAGERSSGEPPRPSMAFTYAHPCTISEHVLLPIFCKFFFFFDSLLFYPKHWLYYVCICNSDRFTCTLNMVSLSWIQELEDKEKLAPNSVPMSGFHEVSPPYKPLRSKSTRTLPPLDPWRALSSQFPFKDTWTI